MTLAEQLRLIRDTMLDALVARWSEAEVRVGDEHVGEHVGPPRVVLCYATADERPPRDLSTNPKTIAERVWDIEAHVWLAEYDPSLDPAERDLMRISDLSTMLDELSRAVYEHTHGSIGGGTPRDATITVVRDVEVLRFGEAAIAVFNLSESVAYGPTLVPVENAAAAVEGDGTVMNVNIDSWGA